MPPFLAFLFGALTAWTASTCYHLNYNDERVEHWQRECDEAHRRRGRAEIESRQAREHEQAARVEMDRVRRAFFDLRHNWHIPPAKDDADLIPAAGVWTPER